MKAIRHRPPGWRRRRLRKFKRRRARRLLRIIESANPKRIRARHVDGEKQLATLFDGPARAFLGDSGIQTGRAQPVRLRPNTPPLRDPEHRLKHRCRKAARASRRANR